MSQQSTAANILNQLTAVMMQLEGNSYSRPLEVLSGNTIGKHVRHIVEFFQYLLNGYESGIIDYDKRQRNPDVENYREVAIDIIQQVVHKIQQLSDKPLVLITHDADGSTEENYTSFRRELTYNIEHTVHHMAILRIAILQEQLSIAIPSDFGVANSTIKYQESLCAQ